MKAVAYVRVSTEDQAEHGVSLAAQEQKIRQYCATYEMELVEVVADAGISGKRLDTRPGAQRVLEMVRTKAVYAVVIVKLDRLSRSIRDLVDIVELVNRKGVSLVSIQERLDTASAAGRLILNVLASLAAFEREQTGERVSMAIRYKRSQGQVYAGEQALYGYCKSAGTLLPVENEQGVITLITEFARTRTVAQICRELEQRGLRTRSGTTHWHRKVVRKILADAGARTEIDRARAVAA